MYRLTLRPQLWGTVGVSTMGTMLLTQDAHSLLPDMSGSGVILQRNAVVHTWFCDIVDSIDFLMGR